MSTCISNRNSEIVEGIGQTMGEATIDKERHTEEQRQHLTFTGKGNHSSHDETATDSQQACTQRTYSEPALKDSLCRSAQLHRRKARQQRHQQATSNITQENPQQLADGTKPTATSLLVAQRDETCRTRIERQLVAYNREQAKRKEHSTDNVSTSQVAPSCNTDGDTRKYGGTKSLYHRLN